MTVAELIADLKCLNQESIIDVSIDVSTGEHDSDRRAFSNEYFGVQANSANDSSVLFGGYLNFKDSVRNV
jgi:hypothetical protein